MEWAVSALHKCFLFDSLGFMTKERFEAVHGPLINLLADAYVSSAPTPAFAQPQPSQPPHPPASSIASSVAAHVLVRLARACVRACMRGEGNVRLLTARARVSERMPVMRRRH